MLEIFNVKKHLQKLTSHIVLPASTSLFQKEVNENFINRYNRNRNWNTEHFDSKEYLEMISTFDEIPDLLEDEEVNSPDFLERKRKVVKKIFSRFLISSQHFPSESFANDFCDASAEDKANILKWIRLAYVDKGWHRESIISSNNAQIDTMYKNSNLAINNSEKIVLLFLGGNATCYEQYLEHFDGLSSQYDYDIMCFNLRNVNESIGETFTPQDWLDDTKAVMNLLVQKGYDLNNIVLKGESLGAAILTKAEDQFTAEFSLNNGKNKKSEVYHQPWLFNSRSFSTLSKAAAGIVNNAVPRVFKFAQKKISQQIINRGGEQDLFFPLFKKSSEVLEGAKELITKDKRIFYVSHFMLDKFLGMIDWNFDPLSSFKSKSSKKDFIATEDDPVISFENASLYAGFLREISESEWGSECESESESQLENHKFLGFGSNSHCVSLNNLIRTKDRVTAEQYVNDFFIKAKRCAQI